MTSSCPKKHDAKIKRLPPKPGFTQWTVGQRSSSQLLEYGFGLLPAKNRSARQWRKLIKRNMQINALMRYANMPQSARAYYWTYYAPVLDERVAEAMWLNHAYWAQLHFRNEVRQMASQLDGLTGLTAVRNAKPGGASRPLSSLILSLQEERKRDAQTTTVRVVKGREKSSGAYKLSYRAAMGGVILPKGV